jgi:tRNA-splicing ligase RtcB (3'-phosphate/5'-hydroxy nucleic acid ligase)
LISHTIFGTGGAWGQYQNHEVIENPLFQELPLLRDLQKKAALQLGTSGSGNHFAEFGIADFPADDRALGIKAGQYVALLTHSGSRALGANIAKYYTQAAMRKRRLPDFARHLAWLRLDESEGAEYWAAMNLAGDYASACHHTIHRKIARELKTQHTVRIENHHNFAWKERLADGTEVIVHRKGATPAKAGELGIIPGSMTAPGYIVRGKGDAASINSAAHGAGRKMSRSDAKQRLTNRALREALEKNDVKLFGGGLDEGPHAYKDIELVMQAQTELVEVLGKFLPRIVRMAGEE